MMIKKVLSFLLLSGSIHAQNSEIFAHRGFGGLHTESTLPGFKAALHYTHVLELDVMVSRDLNVVVTHDPTLHAKLYTYEGVEDKGVLANEKVYDKTFQELALYKMGTTANKAFPQQKKIQETIPLLADVLKETQEYAVVNKLKQPHFFIETKIKETTDDHNHPSPKVVVELLVKELKRQVQAHQVIIQSFDPRTLQYIEKFYSEYRTCLLDKKKQPLSAYLNELDFKPDYFSPSFNEISELTLIESKRYGIPLIGGNSNSKKQIDQMNAWGIHQVISDYPYEKLPQELK